MSKDRKDFIIEALSRYLPARIKEKIEMDPENPHIEGERRRTVVLFMDISGFTAISENLDPEDVAATINDFFSRMHNIIDRYGGEIDKFMGDAMLVLWGAPVTHEDDDERAVRAAMEMMSEIKKFNDDRPKEISSKFPISMTIGINSGLVFAGNVGSLKRMEYTVMGDNVNLAARLEAMANPGEIMISKETRDMLSPEILVKDLGSMPVKGKKEPVQVFLAAGIRSELGELIDRSAFYMDRPEIEKKINAALCKDSPVTVIRGVAGTGKTELIKHNAGNALYFEISSFNRNIPYGFVKTLLRSFMKMNATDKTEMTKSIQDFIKAHKERISDFPVFLDLFEIKQAFEGEEKKWKVFELAAAILGAMEESIIIENFENADQLSRDFFKYFFDTQKIRNKYIFSSREQLFSDIEPVEVPPLDKAGTAEYVKRYFKKDFMPDDLADEIFRISSGNFRLINGVLNYLEKQKLIFLKDEGIYVKIPVKSLKLPQKYTKLILTVFDSLDEYTKKFLQNAAFLGDVFDVGFLNSIINYKEGRIDGVLRKLTEERIVVKEDEGIYRFTDSAFRETVYELVLRSERAKTHGKIAELYEKGSGNQFDIAYHYVRSNNSRKAVQYAKSTAFEAHRNQDHMTAIEFAERGLTFFKKEEFNDDVYELTRTIFTCYFGLAYYEKALELAAKTEKIIERSKDEMRLFTIKNDLAGYNIHLRRMNDALAIIEALLSQGIEKYPSIHINLLLNYSIIYRWNGEYNKAIGILEKTIPIMDATDYKIPEATVYFNIAQNYNSLGDHDRAREFFERAYQSANANKRFSMLCGALTNLGILFYQGRDFGKAREYFDRANKLAKEKYFKYWEAVSLEKVALLYKEEGRRDLALESFEKAIYIAKAIGDPEMLLNFYYNTGLIKLDQNRLTAARADFDLTLGLTEKYEYKIDVKNQIAVLLRKAGLSKKYLEFIRGCRKNKPDEQSAGLFTLHYFIAETELKMNDPDLLKELEILKEKPYWADFEPVYEFFDSLRAYASGEGDERLKRAAASIVSIGDMELTSFLFPEIADVIVKFLPSSLNTLKGTLDDELSKAYLEIIEGKRSADEASAAFFYDNGLYQIADKIKRKGCPGFDMKIGNENVLYGGLNL